MIAAQISGYGLATAILVRFLNRGIARCILGRDASHHGVSLHGAKTSTSRGGLVRLKMHNVSNFVLVWYTDAKHITSDTYKINEKVQKLVEVFDVPMNLTRVAGLVKKCAL